MVKKLQVVINSVVVHEEDAGEFNLMMRARHLQRIWKIDELISSGVACGVYKILASGLHLVDTLKPDWFDNKIPDKDYDEFSYTD